jgi:hypothetical protein
MKAKKKTALRAKEEVTPSVSGTCPCNPCKIFFNAAWRFARAPSLKLYSEAYGMSIPTKLTP